jgi:hypothetical protein
VEGADGSDSTRGRVVGEGKDVSGQDKQETGARKEEGGGGSTSSRSLVLYKTSDRGAC